MEDLKEVKSREVVRRIKMKKEWIWFVQAIFEDTHMAAITLGDSESLTFFYDKKNEDFINEYLSRIFEFLEKEGL
ncbi:MULTISPECIES: hypothetical protein [Caldisericum]|jgi:hypothetical protein|uniref:DUF4911 domain-containing protein n=1 Tax=Caldisericum exile TaxID=693075 RepID=A0A2J6X5P3_9BACT|nr:MAG: hypothetical protein C0189_02400 [Caldisericum exile]PMP81966.1 MAG: hypothetical protein C0175_04500 [Caldisericum exile]